LNEPTFEFNAHPSGLRRSSDCSQCGSTNVIGDQHISGVPRTGSRLTLDLHRLLGTHGKGLLPTGNVSDTIDFDGKSIEYSTVDLANIVFAKAESFGLKGIENPDAMSGNAHLMQRLEEFRLSVGVKHGFAKDLEDADVVCSNSPFLALISKPQDWTEYSGGKQHKAEESDYHAFSVLDGMITSPTR